MRHGHNTTKWHGKFNVSVFLSRGRVEDPVWEVCEQLHVVTAVVYTLNI